jgi:hypothetical protein
MGGTCFATYRQWLPSRIVSATQAGTAFASTYSSKFEQRPLSGRILWKTTHFAFSSSTTTRIPHE